MLLTLPSEIKAAIDAALRPSIATVYRSRILSASEYYADITAPMSTQLPALPTDVKTFAGLAAMAYTRPRQPGRSLFSPSIIQHDLVRLRNGDLTFLPSVGTVLVTKAERAAKAAKSPLTSDREEPVIVCPYIKRPDWMKIDHLEFEPPRKLWSLKRILEWVLGRQTEA